MLDWLVFTYLMVDSKSTHINIIDPIFKQLRSLLSVVIHDISHVFDVIAADLIAESRLPVVLIIELDKRLSSKDEPVDMLNDWHIQIL